MVFSMQPVMDLNSGWFVFEEIAWPQAIPNSIGHCQDSLHRHPDFQTLTTIYHGSDVRKVHA